MVIYNISTWKKNKNIYQTIEQVGLNLSGLWWVKITIRSRPNQTQICLDRNGSDNGL